MSGACCVGSCCRATGSMAAFEGDGGSPRFAESDGEGSRAAERGGEGLQRGGAAPPPCEGEQSEPEGGKPHGVSMSVIGWGSNVGDASIRCAIVAFGMV